MKQALGVLTVLAMVGWLAGCATQGATTQTPTAAPKPESTKTEAKPQVQQEAKPAEAKPAEQPMQATPGVAVVTLASGIEFKVIYFDFDKYDIKPEYRDAIKFDAQQLNKDTNLRVTLEGHCDERGSTEYNLALGERRATAVQKALAAEGVDAKRLKVVSYGEERPVDSGHDEGAWAKNRRSLVSQ